MKQLGILLMNLGSPDSASIADVKKYLTEFLMDKRVIDVPYLVRSYIVKRQIVPKRAPNSAAAYASIWEKDGSPLILLTRQLKEALQQHINLPIALTMRYGNPTPQHAFRELLAQNPDLEEVLLVPLYPQYAASSFETAVLHVEKAHKKYKYPFSLKTLRPYFDDPLYIQSLCTTITPYITDNAYDHLLFSYHGVPKRHILKGDITKKHCLNTGDCCHKDSPAHAFCYRHQCIKTTDLVAAQLALPKHKHSYSFQSRLGKDLWLQPYTIDRFHQLPKEGVKRLLVVCPAFVSDCLETLEEIAEEGKKAFLTAGGQSFTMIPCLNITSDWVGALTHWIQQYPKYCYKKALSALIP